MSDAISKVKRYDLLGEYDPLMLPCDDGDYVRYDDVVEALQSGEPVGQVYFTADGAIDVNWFDANKLAEDDLLYTTPQPVVPDAEALARMFHEGYERLASVAGYETRMETRSFNLESPNGKLMVLVCAEIRKALLSAGAVAAPQPVVDVNQQLVEALRNVLEEAEECFLAIEEEWGVTKSLKELEEAGKLPEPIIKARLALLSAGKGGE